MTIIIIFFHYIIYISRASLAYKLLIRIYFFFITRIIYDINIIGPENFCKILKRHKRHN